MGERNIIDHDMTCCMSSRNNNKSFKHAEVNINPVSLHSTVPPDYLPPFHLLADRPRHQHLPYYDKGHYYTSTDTLDFIPSASPLTLQISSTARLSGIVEAKFCTSGESFHQDSARHG